MTMIRMNEGTEEPVMTEAARHRTHSQCEQRLGAEWLAVAASGRYKAYHRVICTDMRHATGTGEKEEKVGIVTMTIEGAEEHELYSCSS